MLKTLSLTQLQLRFHYAFLEIKYIHYSGDEKSFSKTNRRISVVFETFHPVATLFRATLLETGDFLLHVDDNRLEQASTTKFDQFRDVGIADTVQVLGRFLSHVR